MSGLGASAFLVLAFASAFAGCCLLALSQDRHGQAVAGSRPTPATRSRRRLFGWGLAGLSLIACIARDGSGFAALLWPILFAVAAGAVAMILTYHPVALRPLAKLTGTVGDVTSGVQSRDSRLRCR